MLGFDTFLARQRREELRRGAQAWTLEKRLRARLEHRPAVKRVMTLFGGGRAPREHESANVEERVDGNSAHTRRRAMSHRVKAGLPSQGNASRGART